MKKQKIIFTILISIVSFFFILFFFISPKDVVSQIGIHNVYIVAFLVSLFGGLSALGSASFIGLIISLVLSGIHPLKLALVCGVALTIGDMFIFTAFSQGRRLIKKSWDKKIRKLSKYLQKNKFLSFFTPAFAYTYIGFLPLPNDILLVFLGTIDYPKGRTYLIIFLGDMTFTLLLAYATYFGLAFW